MGYRVIPGGVGGGGDHLLFVPVSNITSVFERFRMFSLDHVVELSNIFVHASPSALIVALVLVYSAAAPKRRRFLMNLCSDYDPAVFTTVIITLCYLGFAFLWNFDLGYPLDVDLMISLGLTENLFMFAIVNRLFRTNRMAVLVVALAGLCFNLLFVSAFIHPRIG
jgi:hypothetical protein